MSNQLSIPFKKTSAIPIRQAVHDYLQKSHPDTHAATFDWDVQRWEELRKNASKGVAHASQIQTLMRWVV